MPQREPCHDSAKKKKMTNLSFRFKIFHQNYHDSLLVGAYFVISSCFLGETFFLNFGPANLYNNYKLHDNGSSFKDQGSFGAFFCVGPGQDLKKASMALPI